MDKNAQKLLTKELSKQYKMCNNSSRLNPWQIQLWFPEKSFKTIDLNYPAVNAVDDSNSQAIGHDGKKAF